MLNAIGAAVYLAIGALIYSEVNKHAGKGVSLNFLIFIAVITLWPVLALGILGVAIFSASKDIRDSGGEKP